MAAFGKSKFGNKIAGKSYGKSFDSRKDEGDSRSYGKKRFSRGDDRQGSERSFGRGQSHEVICAKCGIQTDVPFKPTTSKPVYCRDCFKKNDSYDDSGSSGRFESRSRSSSSNSDELKEIHKKLDKILEIMETLELDSAEEDEEDEK